jgi:phosphoribosylanthranilate isomerase
MDTNWIVIQLNGLRKQSEYVRDGSKCQLISGLLIVTYLTGIIFVFGCFDMIVQIYEIQTPKEAESVIALGVDHVGSVIATTDAWADQNVKAVLELVRQAGKRSSLIPLFSDIETIFRCLDCQQPDIVHFCESIAPSNPPDRKVEKLLAIQESVRRQFPQIKIMRSIPIPQPGYGNGAGVISIARAFEPLCDYFLTDTLLNNRSAGDPGASQPVNGFVGITGRVCDWQIAAELVDSSSIPVILAGGLGPENVFDGIRKVKPSGVDSCTATNAKDAAGRAIRFKKDLTKVGRFVAAARKADLAVAKKGWDGYSMGVL